MRPSMVGATLLLLSSGAAGQTAPNPAPPSGCDSKESHQFDFWIGRWSVTVKDHPEREVARSLIEKLYAGCGVRENWMPKSSAGGGSLSSYVAAEKAWRQTWVDSSGSRVDFKGGWNGSAMILTGVWPQPGHPNQLTRMTYTAARDGSVRQLGETSDDEGKTWTPGFDFIYRKAP